MKRTTQNFASKMAMGNKLPEPFEDTTSPDTLALHAGFRRDPVSNAVTVPMHLSTAFELDGDLEKIADVYNCKDDGYTYSRIINPTNRALERKFAAVDQAVDALAVASGQSATFLAIANLIGLFPGSNIVVSKFLYGNSWNLFHNTFKRLGVEARTADPRRPESYANQIDEQTICLFAEAISNPFLVPCHIGGLVEVGRNAGVPVIIDNTTTPLVCRPGQHGAAQSTYSATKYICGHGTVLGGLIVDYGTFDFSKEASRFPLFSQPDEAHGDIVWVDAADRLGELGKSYPLLKTRMTWVRDTGGCMSPFNSFQLIQGLETLSLRMERHSQNALEVAEMLGNHPKVSSVRYPELFSGLEGQIAKEICDHSMGFGGMLMFDVADEQSGRKLVEAVKMIYHVSNVGDARTLITHPVSTTHATVPQKKRLAAGINYGTIRLCVGIEDVQDIIRDLEQALELI